MYTVAELNENLPITLQNIQGQKGEYSTNNWYLWK